MSVDFKGAHYPKSVILYAVYFYVRYGVSYRDLEEIMEERGAEVDHATLNRWVVKFGSLMAAQAQSRKKPTAKSWRMDETYIKVKGRWVYYYRTVDKFGAVIDFYLSETRDEPAARAFFNKAINQHGLPEKVVIDKIGANAAALDTVNILLWLSGCMLFMIEELAVKYLNNIVEQSHRKVKGKMHQCLGWKSLEGVESTLAGVELWSMIKLGQMDTVETMTPWEQFYSLAA